MLYLTIRIDEGNSKVNFFWNCQINIVMVMYHERRNGILTYNAGKEIFEFLDITCGYILKSESELRKCVGL